jgi:hypothetical protein
MKTPRKPVRFASSKVVTLDYTSYTNTPDDFTYMPTSCNVISGMQVTFKLAPDSDGQFFQITFNGPSPFNKKNINSQKKRKAKVTVVGPKLLRPVVYHYTAMITDKNGNNHDDGGNHCPTIIVGN